MFACSWLGFLWLGTFGTVCLIVQGHENSEMASLANPFLSSHPVAGGEGNRPYWSHSGDSSQPFPISDNPLSQTEASCLLPSQLGPRGGLLLSGLEAASGDQEHFALPPCLEVCMVRQQVGGSHMFSPPACNGGCGSPLSPILSRASGSPSIIWL